MKDENMKTFKCLICGEVFTVEDDQEPICPKCKAKGNKLVEIKAPDVCPVCNHPQIIF